MVTKSPLSGCGVALGQDDRPLGPHGAQLQDTGCLWDSTGILVVTRPRLHGGLSVGLCGIQSLCLSVIG